ncbi:uncharacterized protein LOC18436609 [Amborella trichopoda]|uniref:uncharacterized protein LOC18436609 n=1 Tax=Amborella trichopoda TaxID=13333 RepID=UPI0005D3E32E|nr:uncharacterized protein LOC18436609 [Amborella trichopoda]|eukprot:XP_006846901.2 uncharacterized protein LOC18436609 [Amborella trichopoda]
MSRCFPFLPPGYGDNGRDGGFLSLSSKEDRRKAKREKKEREKEKIEKREISNRERKEARHGDCDRKIEKKEISNQERKEAKHGDCDRGSKHEKRNSMLESCTGRKEEECEHMEKSGLTEEHGQLTCDNHLDSAHSMASNTNNNKLYGTHSIPINTCDNKRKRVHHEMGSSINEPLEQKLKSIAHTHGSGLWIRLPSLKNKSQQLLDKQASVLREEPLQRPPLNRQSQATHLSICKTKEPQQGPKKQSQARPPLLKTKEPLLLHKQSQATWPRLLQTEEARVLNKQRQATQAPLVKTKDLQKLLNKQSWATQPHLVKIKESSQVLDEEEAPLPTVGSDHQRRKDTNVRAETSNRCNTELSEEDLFATLIKEWKPIPIHQELSGVDNMEWLYEREQQQELRSDELEDIRVAKSALGSSSSAFYMPSIGIHALPFVLPF